MVISNLSLQADRKAAAELSSCMARSIGIRRMAAAVVLGLGAPLAAAQGFDHLQIDTKQCALVTSGSKNQDVIARGEKQFEHCSIRLSVQEFQRRYSYCALSGVLATKGRVLCEFGYSDAAKTKVFFMSGPDQLCEFVCVHK